jgi:hypothetical protein
MKPKFLFVTVGILVISIMACTGSPTSTVNPSVPFETRPVAVPPANSQTQPLPPSSGNLVNPASLQYLGAFRLPGGSDPPKTFAYGGNAMTFNPDGNPDGTADGFRGSLFVMGHNRIAYGDVPDGNQVAEISIPIPVRSRNLQDLNTAGFLQDFQNVLMGYFTNLEEIPRVGMAYLNHPKTGPKIHVAWGQHLQMPGDASHGWFNPTLNMPQVQGFWFIGKRDPYSTNGYLFEIPSAWADTYTGGRYLATGRMRDGGMGGMGPALFAYRPWLADGSPPLAGTRLEEIPLLLYENAYNTSEIIHSLNGYQHPDEWEGGAWITTASGKQAVLFVGTKSTGKKYWYGYMHPNGPQYACIDDQAEAFEGICRNADGSICPKQDFTGCCDDPAGTCISSRGWWSDRFDTQFILYDPGDLAKVANGQLEPWQPQPYAVIDIDEQLYLNPPQWDRVNLGWGDQRRYRIGDVAFDRQNGLLYVLELYADEAKPVVHVWKINVLLQ